MQLQIANRQNTKIKLALQGPSGSGKTYSSLLLAYGLRNNWSKIAVIDTENHSAELYAHLGSFQVLHLTAPYTPERFVQAIAACEKAGAEVIIIDSISHEWDGAGGILSIHSAMTGNSYTNWAKVTSRHNAFVQAILQSPVHVVCTIRTKQEYVLTEKNGKQVPEKIGLKGITRDGMDYEFTLLFQLDMHNCASASKDRTGLFMHKPSFVITSDTGKQLVEWCNPLNETALKQQISQCGTLRALSDLYNAYPTLQAVLLGDFQQRRKQLETGFHHNNAAINSHSYTGNTFH
ncbi:AAA family ATPase [Deminuibacter soli]|uniref:AAA family ATPase n=1 Tax=Deminuibacter soli TaxID=2291815 RepID=A0A3E1NJ20_9BACT|nr:AAA family ATPase [Deminuibacter soli]RFM27929.1 AAA family ATPase [Deminuibacter soli]